jgi:beta-phosphoglucomutase-like phosphatase (HAD superfamily)
LKLGIVSSNDRVWVDVHLSRLEIADTWDVIITADGDTERAKPNPAMYVEALTALGVGPTEAVALEDSPHGVAAAKAAGIFCVAIPNEVTAELDLSGADLTVGSLEALPLEQLLEAASARR